MSKVKKPLNSHARKLTRQQRQDLYDGIRADKILAEMRRTGESYSVEQLREEFGISKELTAATHIKPPNNPSLPSS